jgi:tetratricopeptide (TPR) repeat protein
MKLRTLGWAGLIVLGGWWVYQPALQGGWLWDDYVDIVRNPVIHDPSGWWKIWLAPTGWHFFPLKSLVQWAQWQLWQEQTTGYHITNLALHVTGALLLWRLLMRLGLRHGWVGGLLFAVHPVTVESVAWIAELKNTLSLPLLLLAALAWVDYDERGRGRDYARSLLLFVAAMLAKSSVVMFPGCLLLHRAWRHGRISRSAVRASLPFFAVSLGLGVVTVWFEQPQDLAIGALMPVLGFWSRLAGAGGAIGFYFLKCFAPAGLSPVYVEWPLAEPSLLWFLPWLAVLVGGALLWRSWATWGRHAGLGLGFFLLNLVPVLGFVPMAYHHIAWVADHFVYLPLVGLAGLAAAGADGFGQRPGQWSRPLVPALGLGLAAVLAVPAHRYAAVFRDEEALWSHAVAVQPDSWLAHHELAFVLARTQRPDGAILHYQAALRLKPANADAANNLGNALLAKDRIAEAIAVYQQAIRARPAYAEAHANLGNALARAGSRAEAIAACEHALQLDPACLPAHVTLGDLFSQDGRQLEASRHYAAALQLSPDDPVLLNNQATLLLQLGRPAEAQRHYEQAVQLAPGYVEARVNLGYALSTLGQTDAAVATWREALRLAPNTAAARVGLGNVFVQSGHPAEAEEQYRAALQLQPNDAEVRNNLAYALAQQGRIDEAVRQCEEALRLQPGYAAARENLARLRALK